MALGTPTNNGAAYSAAGGTTVAPLFPTGIVANDVLLLFVGQKPNAANGGTVTTPTGWTLRESLTGAGGYGATLGADTGNTNLFVYTKDTVAGTETGSLTVTVGANDVCWSTILRIPTFGAGATFAYGTADGSRTTAPTSGTAFTVTLTNGVTAPNIASGDMTVWAMCIPTDVNVNGFSAPTITSTGTTFGTAVELVEPNNGNGNDIGGYVAYAAATAGTSSVAPTVGVTATGTVTNYRGPIALVRVRETLPARTGTLAVTESGADTLAAAGAVTVAGTLAATESGSDTFASSGTVAWVAISGTAAATETGSDSTAIPGQVVVAGALSVTDAGPEAFVGSGTVAWAPSSGTLGATETGADAFAGAATVTVQGTAGANEAGGDALSGSGVVPITGALSVTETGADSASLPGQVTIVGTGSAAFLLSQTATAVAIGQLVADASPALGLTAAACGSVALRAEASAPILLEVTAASAVAIGASVTGTLTVAISAGGTIASRASAAAAVGLTMTATAVAETPVQALVALQLTGQSAGGVSVFGAAACPLSLGTTAAGTVALRLQGNAGLTLQGQGAAVVQVQGQAQAGLALQAAAVSTVPAPVVLANNSRRRIVLETPAVARYADGLCTEAGDTLLQENGAALIAQVREQALAAYRPVMARLTVQVTAAFRLTLEAPAVARYADVLRTESGDALIQEDGARLILQVRERDITAYSASSPRLTLLQVLSSPRLRVQEATVTPS